MSKQGRFIILAVLGLVVLASCAQASQCQAVHFSTNKEQLTRERKILEPFLAKVAKEMGADSLLEKQKQELRNYVELSTIDLNHDGYKEILAIITHPIFCGVKNCALYILDGKSAAMSGDMRPLLSDVSVVPHGIFILSSTANEYPDLEFQDGSGKGSIWEFDGAFYHYKGAISSVCRGDFLPN